MKLAALPEVYVCCVAIIIVTAYLFISAGCWTVSNMLCIFSKHSCLLLSGLQEECNVKSLDYWNPHVAVTINGGLLRDFTQ